MDLIYVYTVRLGKGDIIKFLPSVNVFSGSTMMDRQFTLSVVTGRESWLNAGGSPGTMYQSTCTFGAMSGCGSALFHRIKDAMILYKVGVLRELTSG